MINYEEFITKKQPKIFPTGFDIDVNKLNSNLFPFQKAIVKWALKKGKSALFADTGLGKTPMQLSWAEEICKHTNGKVLILAPLAVSKQTVLEGEKFNIKVNLCESEFDVLQGINITNYEKIHKFNTDVFDGIVLDESSIIKSYNGKTTMDLIDRFKGTKYKLCCTATPSPNDYTELGQHAEFLNVMTSGEMLAMFFINDSSHGMGWRLKGHSEKEFYKWIAEWAFMIKNPDDIGFDGSAYNLPKLNIISHIIDSEPDGGLFVTYAETLAERREARKESLFDRVNMANDLIKSTNNCLIWCDYNDESNALAKVINESIEVKGSDTPEHKENAMIGFAKNTVKYLISKPSICGFGMNWQNCHDMIFCGLSDSYERFYQAIRRCYRFGQNNEVNVHIIISEKEMNVLENIKKKENNDNKMKNSMIEIISDILKGEIHKTTRKQTIYKANKEMILPSFVLGGN